MHCTEILGSLSRQHFHQRSLLLSALLYLSLHLKAFSAPFFTTIHDLHDLLLLSSSLLVLHTHLLRYHYILTFSDIQLPFRLLKFLYFIRFQEPTLQLDISSPLWIITQGIGSSLAFIPPLSLIHHISYG